MISRALDRVRVLGIAALAGVASLGALPEQAAGQGAGQGQKVIQIPIRTDGPKSLDPAKGSTTYDNFAISQVYETLLQQKYLKRSGELLEPLLCTEMPKITDNPDGTQTWKFTLRPGVRFHDDACFEGGKGREIVTDDVFYSWKRLADPEYELENWWLLKDTIAGFDAFKEEQAAAVKAGKKFDYAAPVAGLKKISDKEFEVVLARPVTRFKWVLSMFQTSVVPREAVEKYGTRFSVHPVGTGPFTVTEGDWKPGQSLVFKRNPNYPEAYYPTEHEPEDVELGLAQAAGKRIPMVDRVECTMYVPDNPMWLDFNSGKLGFIQTPAEYFNLAWSRRTKKVLPEVAQKGIVGHAVPLLDFIFRGFNMEDTLIGGYTEEKRALRKAIHLAVDHEAFNESFYNGLNIVFDGPIPPGLDGHPEDGLVDPDVSLQGPDLARAAEYLEKAGYPGGKGLAPLEYYVSQGGNESEQVQMLIRQLDKIGVKVNPHMVPFSELIEAVNKKKAQMFGYAWGSDYPDAENNLALFYTPNAAPGSNSFNYSRPEFDKLYERILVMPPGEERTKLYEQMRDMIINDAPYVGSMARTRFWLVNPWLKNFKPSEDFYNWVKYLDVDDSKR